MLAVFQGEWEAALSIVGRNLLLIFKMISRVIICFRIVRRDEAN